MRIVGPVTISALATALTASAALLGGSPAAASATVVLAQWDMNAAPGATAMLASSGHAINGMVGSAVQTGAVFDGATAFRWSNVKPNQPPAKPERLVQVANSALNPGTRDYAVTIQGDVVEGVQGPTVTAQVWPELQKLMAKMPPGYRIEVAGAVEESGKGQGSIAAGVPVMLFIIFTLLMLQLHSFSRALLVFLTGPLGIAGVAAALLLLNRPFGFVALLGVIALMGMIMRNSVILIDQIEQDRAKGVPTWNAIVEAAVRRFRPIILTAAAAVLAMIPLSRSVFWGPMAVAIMGGLIVATALTLLALPAMYAAWFRVKRVLPGAG